MSSVPFHYLDLRAFSYATEDERRVEDALGTLLPPDTEVERTESSGHHGDPIVVLETRVETADEIRTIFDRLLGMESFADVQEAVAERINENLAFFVRVDKQRAFQGEVAKGPGIQIRGKVEAYPATREGAIENVKQYLSTVA